MELTWEECQRNANLLLANGLFHLKSQPYVTCKEVVSKHPGNYLISLSQVARYIGEAKVLSKRVKQQFDGKTSTFYKTFQKQNINIVEAV